MNLFKWSIIIILAIILIFIVYFSFSDKAEHMIDIAPISNPTWSRNQCDYTFNNTMKKVFDNYGINDSGDGNSWDIYLPCTYDDINKEIADIKVDGKKNKRIFILNNADYVIGKDFLWYFLRKYYGLNKAAEIMPMTYLLDDQEDVRRLAHDYDSNKLYIIKKNIQRQEGLKIADSLDDILESSKDGYVIAQELLQNPYLINERKINLRVYVLTICKGDNMDVFVYNDGFMYYTKDYFVKGSKEFGPNITTGYIDRSVYQQNPLTHEDFKKYLDDPNRKKTPIENNIEVNGTQENYFSRNSSRKSGKLSEYVFSNIYKLLHDIFKSFVGAICGGKLNDNITFQLFGADIAIDEELQPMIMEINKGPDMNAKDGRDGDLKYKCMRDIFDKLGALKNEDTNGFIQILEHEG